MNMSLNRTLFLLIDVIYIRCSRFAEFVLAALPTPNVYGIRINYIQIRKAKSKNQRAEYNGRRRPYAFFCFLFSRSGRLFFLFPPESRDAAADEVKKGNQSKESVRQSVTQMLFFFSFLVRIYVRM